MTYTHHPLGIAVALFLEGKHALVGVAEGKVQSLSWEVSNDIGCVASPESHGTFTLYGSAEAINDTVVFSVKSTSFQHLILFITYKYTFDTLKRKGPFDDFAFLERSFALG